MDKDLEVKKIMPALAKTIDKILPEGYGFCLFTFGFGDIGEEAMYASNADREDVVELMKEWIEHIEEDYDSEAGEFDL